MIWNSPLRSNKFTEGHSMKIEGLIADVTFVGSPARAERYMLRVIFDGFWPIQDAFVVWEPFCHLEIPSWWMLITLLGVL